MEKNNKHISPTFINWLEQQQYTIRVEDWYWRIKKGGIWSIHEVIDMCTHGL